MPQLRQGLRFDLKNHQDILAGINSGLQSIIADGTYKTIFNKYFPGVPVPPEYGG